jgi:hypothetical protein
MIKENLVAETIEKNSQKIVQNSGMQECEHEWILEHKNLEREFLDFKEFQKKANMLSLICNPMHF